MRRLLDDPYFSLPPPKSTGKEYFNLGYVTSRLDDRDGPDPHLDDLLASLTVATAEMVASALRPFDLGELLVAGGGTRNTFLMGELRSRLPGVRIRRTDELGVPEAAKEALVFAIIGFLTLSGLPATIPSCTGALRPSVLGSITPGPRPAPAQRAPRARFAHAPRHAFSAGLELRDDAAGIERAIRPGNSAIRPGNSALAVAPRCSHRRSGAAGARARSSAVSTSRCLPVRSSGSSGRAARARRSRSFRCYGSSPTRRCDC